MILRLPLEDKIVGQLALCYDTSMNPLPDDQNLKTSALNQASSAPIIPSASGAHKEVELPGSVETAAIEEVVADIELEPEVEASGIEKRSETINLPPDLKQAGVEAVGPAQPHGSGATVQLPLVDDQIVQGLHVQIISSFRWLAEWCIRQLKKAHLHLQVISGKVMRIKD